MAGLSILEDFERREEEARNPIRAQQAAARQILEKFDQDEAAEAEVRDEDEPSALAALFGGGITGGAGLLGAIGTGAAVGAFTGNPIGIAAGAIVGGIGASLGAEWGKGEAAESTGGIGRTFRNIQEAERAHPVLSAVGSFVPQAPLGLASLARSGALIKAAGRIPGAASQMFRQELKRGAVGGVFGGGISAVAQGGIGKLQGRDFLESIDPTILAGDILFGGVTTRPGITQAERKGFALEKLALAKKAIESDSVLAIGDAGRFAREFQKAGGPVIDFDQTTGAPILPQTERTNVNSPIRRALIDNTIEAKETRQQVWRKAAADMRQEGEALIQAGEESKGSLLIQKSEEALKDLERSDETFINRTGAGAKAREIFEEGVSNAYGPTWLRGLPKAARKAMGLRDIISGDLDEEFSSYLVAKDRLEKTQRKRTQLDTQARQQMSVEVERSLRKGKRIEKLFEGKIAAAERGVAALQRTAERVRKSGAKNLTAAETALVQKSQAEMLTGVRLALETPSVNAPAKMAGKQGQIFTEMQKSTIRLLRKPIKTAKDLLKVADQTGEIGRFERTKAALERQRQKSIDNLMGQTHRKIKAIQDASDARGLKSPYDEATMQRIINHFEADPEKGPLFTRGHDALQEMNKRTNQFALDEQVLTPDLAENLARSKSYHPSEFTQHADLLNGLNGIEKTADGGILSVMDPGIKELDEGAVRALVTDTRSLFEAQTNAMVQRSFNNRGQLDLLQMARQTVDPDFIRVATAEEINGFRSGDVDIPGEKMILHALENGERQYMIVDKRWAQGWGSAPKEIRPQLANALQWVLGTKVLKAMATGMNPAFALTNLPRDFLHNFLATNAWTGTGWSKRIPVLGLAQQGIDYIGVLPDVIKKGALHKRFIDAGGGMDFLSTQGRIQSKIPEIQALGSALGVVGEKSELLGRLALFKRALRKHAPDVEAKRMTQKQADIAAATQAREALDFAQHGSIGKALDTFLPYFNASIQGTRSIFKGAKAQGLPQFANKVANLMAMGSGLYLYNRLYNSEAYDQVSEKERLGNFIITLPGYTIDKNGDKKYNYIRIAKDQGQRSFMALAESLMARAVEGKLPDDTWMQVINGVREAFPILSDMGVSPPVIQAFLGASANRDFWRRQDIWAGPEVQAQDEIKRFTSPVAIDLGRATGFSPAKLDYIARTIWTSNIWTSLAGGAWRGMVDDLPAEVKDEMNGVLSDAFRRQFQSRVVRQTSPASASTALFRGIRELKEGRNSTTRRMESLVKAGRGEEARDVGRRWNDQAASILGPLVASAEERGQKPGPGFIKRFIIDDNDVRRMLLRVQNEQSSTERALAIKGQPNAEFDIVAAAQQLGVRPPRRQRRQRRERSVSSL